MESVYIHVQLNSALQHFCNIRLSGSDHAAEEVRQEAGPDVICRQKPLRDCIPSSWAVVPST